MRDEAKKGLQRMSDIGQMGNADEVGEASNGTYEDEGFESEIDDILGEIEAEEQGRDVNEQTEVMMAEGGFMKSGTDLTKAPKNPVFDVRYYKNADGSVMYITHINGKPMTPIPEGYKAVTQEEAQKVGQKAEEAAKATQAQQQESSYDATQLDKSVADFLDEEARQQAEFDAQGRSKEGPREQRMGKVSNVMETIAKWATPYGTVRNVMDFLKGPQRTDEEADKIPTEKRDLPGIGAQQAATLAGELAFQRASESGLSEPASRDFARQASDAASIFSRSGMDVQTAARTAVEEQQNLRDIEANQGESSVGTPDTGRGEPESFSTGDWGGLAKGGLVNKRQYPAKKKRGKGLASAKT